MQSSCGFSGANALAESDKLRAAFAATCGACLKILSTIMCVYALCYYILCYYTVFKRIKTQQLQSYCKVKAAEDDNC